jgi:hypothetical protein
MDLISLLFLVGPVGVVPLGLVILQKRTLSRREQVMLRIIRWIHPFAALAVIGSFMGVPGRLAAALVLPWLILGALCGLTALLRIINGGWHFPGVCYTAALAYLPVGAAWLFASRAGINPGGFGEPIVLLTAVHFHFSGLGASIMAGEVARHLPGNSWTQRWIITGALLGTPLIATGFVFSPPLKMVAIVFFGSTLVTLAVMQFLLTRRMDSGWSRLALRISSVSIAIGMILAAIYGVTDYFDWAALSIPQMARWHGTLNALGFTLCGLLGWSFSKAEAAPLDQNVENSK